MLVDSSGGGVGILDQARTVTSGGTYTVLNLDISALTDAPADLTDLEDYIGGVDAAISAMTDAGTVLGAAKTRINTQKDFVSTLMDAIDTGVGQLVDADMNEEFDPAPGAAGAPAARRPGAQPRESVGADDPPALPSG